MARSAIQILVWLGVWLAAAGWLAFHITPRDEGVSIPYTMSNSVLAGQDTVSHDYPAFWWGWQQIGKTGYIPLWNPSWFAGEPFVASQTFMPFYPPGWLSAVLPFPLAFNFQYPLHLILAALAMAWACRRRGLGWLAAGLAGLSWGFGGHLATLVGPGHIQKLQTLAWLPVVITGMRELAGERPRRGMIPFAFGLALQITAGHLQIVWMTLGVGTIEAFAVFIQRLFKFRDARSALRSFGWGAAAVGLALGLSAAFWVPTVEFARMSNRQGKLSWEDETRGSLPLDEAVEFMLPRLLGDSMPGGRGGYVGRYGESLPESSIKLTPERVVSDYVGAGAIVFALAGLIIARGRRRQVLGYMLLAAGALLLSLGRYVPGFYRAALEAIPGLAHFRSPSTMMAILAYGLIMAASIGVDACARAVSNPNKRRLAKIDLALFIFLGVMMLAGAIGFDSVQIDATPETQKSVFILAAAKHVVWALLTVTLPFVLWAIAVPRIKSAGSRRWFGAALLALMTLAWGRDLIVNDRPFWTGMHEEPYRYWLTHHWAMKTWSHEEVPVRYIQLGNELSNQALTLSDYGPPNFREIASAHGYHPVAYGRYFDLLSRLGFTNTNFARLFGMQYTIVPVGSGSPPPGWQIVRQSDNKQFYLLNNPRIDYVRQVRHIQVVEDWKALLDRLADSRFNAYESTTVTNEDMENKPEYFNISVPMQDIRMNARVFPGGPGWIELRLTTTRSGPIELAEPWAPGWRVMLDGQDRTQSMLMRLDGYFIGILAPAGQSAIQLCYDPASQRLGVYTTLLALGVAAFAGGLSIGGRRRN